MSLSDTQHWVLGLLADGYIMVHHTGWGDSLDFKTWMRMPRSDLPTIRVRYPTYEHLLLGGYLKTIMQDPSGFGYIISEAGRAALEKEARTP